MQQEEEESVRGPDGHLYKRVFIPVESLMQAPAESGHPAANNMMPPGQGYAYTPLVTGQMPMSMYASAPAGSYKAAQGAVDELSNQFAGMKPVYPHPGLHGMAPIAYSDGRNVYQPQPVVNAGHFVMPHQMAQYSGMPGPGQYMWARASHEGADMPPLARRASESSNGEAGPQTPFVAGQYPSEAYKKHTGAQYDTSQPWTTPSPYSLTYGTSMPQQLWKQNGEYMPVDYDRLCDADPTIPRPVPAIFSSEKSRGTLDKCLKNDTNTTNVYIRGLHPNTTDDMLHGYGSRFGTIMSAKSMLDQATGACKGFGFIKYHNFDDGENCIRGFFHLGYEAKWARVSHNERLKTLSDEANTNLYISNLPMSFNEQMLTSTFSEYEVMSAKILRDENGISRGVGFARFGSPNICQEIIAKYNNYPVMEGHNLSIRFADTPEQKKLKSLTAERRQFKTHEYNTAAYGPGSPYGSSASPVVGNVPSPVVGRFNLSPGGVFVPVPHASAGAQMTSKSHENIIPASVQAHNAAIRNESPSISAQSKRVVGSQAKTAGVKIEAPVSDDEEEISTPLRNVTNTNARFDRRISPSKSAVKGGSPAHRAVLDGGARTTPSKTPRSKRV